jgi:hypothetical protein
MRLTKRDIIENSINYEWEWLQERAVDDPKVYEEAIKTMLRHGFIGYEKMDNDSLINKAIDTGQLMGDL